MKVQYKTKMLVTNALSSIKRGSIEYNANEDVSLIFADSGTTLLRALLECLVFCRGAVSKSESAVVMINCVSHTLNPASGVLKGGTLLLTKTAAVTNVTVCSLNDYIPSFPCALLDTYSVDHYIGELEALVPFAELNGTAEFGDVFFKLDDEPQLLSHYLN
jgi:hypothetical protein